MHIVKVKKTELRAGITTTGSVLPLRAFVDSRGEELALSDFGSFFVVVVKQGDKTEIIRCNGITQNGDGTADLAIESGWRDISPKPPYTGNTTGQAFQTGAEVICSNDPYTMSLMLQLANPTPQTVTGDIRFPTPTNGANAATKAYADGIAAAGAPTASTTVRGISMLSESPDTTLGTFTVTVATPAVFTAAGHGLQENDTVKFTTTGALPTGLAVSTDYYVIATGLTADEFQVSTSLGGAAVDTSGVQNGVHTLIRTTPYVVSEGNAKLPTLDEKAALEGAGAAPSPTNKFMTEQDAKDVSFFPVPIVKTFSLTNIFGDSTTQFDITNPSGTTFRYTWDGTGTTPGISAATLPIGTQIVISGQNFNAANNGGFVVTASGTNYFEISNASGVAETNVTLGTGYLRYGYIPPEGLKYIIVEGVAGGGGGDGTSGDEEAAGGAGGGYFRKLIAASALGAFQYLIIGKAGTAGSSTPTNGGAGGQTAFGAFCSANGGAGGGTTGGAQGNALGGTATGGDVNVPGQDGGEGTGNSGTSGGHGNGDGGDSMLGLGAKQGNAGSPGAAKGYGAGGCGAVSDNSSNAGGGAGTQGLIIITEYY